MKSPILAKTNLATVYLRSSLLLFLFIRNLSFASGDSLEVYESDTLALRFCHPSGFVVGSYDTTDDLTGHFRKLVVLVEPIELGKYSRSAIPVGDVPTVSIGIESRAQGEFLKSFTDTEIMKRFFSRDIKEAEFRKKVGTYTVYQLPGYPGPHGEAFYYYLVNHRGSCPSFCHHRERIKMTRSPV